MRYIPALCACLASPAFAEGSRAPVNILPVHGIVSAVMGDVREAEMIVARGTSPHSPSLKPSDARALQKADLVVPRSGRQ